MQHRRREGGREEGRRDGCELSGTKRRKKKFSDGAFWGHSDFLKKGREEK